MRIHLQFSPEQNATHRRRLEYAFRVFCAIYGHTPSLDRESAEAPDVWISYRPDDLPAGGRPILYLKNLYRPRLPIEPAPAPRKYSRDGQSTFLVHMSSPEQQPDWLGEIFEWLSCADEYAVKERDQWQRVPAAASYVGRHRLDAWTPYAAVAMRFLNAALCRLLFQRPTDPQSPIPMVNHFVVPTHDVDYLPLNRYEGVQRIAKNAAISLVSAKRPLLAIRQAGMALQMAFGSADPLDQLSLLSRAEEAQKISASYYFLPQRLHSKDANYSLESRGVLETLRNLEDQRMEVGVHGTYTSAEKPHRMADEYRLFRAAGFHPQGGRQHWLRFTLDQLIRGLERSGAAYDTSIGWADRIGYRAGACFAFPPYNFDEERPATFLEIPMAIMDVALRDQGSPEEDWYDEAMGLLSASRRFGWGGISLLWHPAAFGGAWLASEAGHVFWKLLADRDAYGELWLSGAEFLIAARGRYVNAGLWPAARKMQDTETSGHRSEKIKCTEMLEPSRVI